MNPPPSPNDKQMIKLRENTNFEHSAVNDGKGGVKKK